MLSEHGRGERREGAHRKMIPDPDPVLSTTLSLSNERRSRISLTVMHKNNVLGANAIISSQLKRPPATNIAVVQTPYGRDHRIHADRAGTAEVTLTSPARTFCGSRATKNGCIRPLEGHVVWQDRLRGSHWLCWLPWLNHCPVNGCSCPRHSRVDLPFLAVQISCTGRRVAWNERVFAPHIHT
jgi:hypothetical protein